MNARNREDMVRAFQAAFDEWERRTGFTGEVPLPMQRGEYFAALLDELAAGQPWATIGPGHPAEP